MSRPKHKQPSRGWVKQDDRLFTVEVCITSGPMTEKFIKKNKTISRTIQIRGDQALEDLHNAIFDAFGREDEEAFAQIEALCRQKNWEMPHVLFCTGFTPPDSVVKTVGDGSQHGLLMKPFTMSDLNAGVRKHL